MRGKEGEGEGRERGREGGREREMKEGKGDHKQNGLHRYDTAHG